MKDTLTFAGVLLAAVALTLSAVAGLFAAGIWIANSSDNPVVTWTGLGLAGFATTIVWMAWAWSSQ